MAEPKRVALFVTCLVDLFRPSIGFAAVKLLEQTCCGQPAYNSGDKRHTKTVARQVIAAFSGFDYVVVPSGSCAGMIKIHYPALFADEPELAERARELAARTYELVAFLVDVMGMTRVAATHAGSVTYHDSCSGLRELGVKSQPRQLLASVTGLTLNEMPDCEVCCGFGGTFAVKYPEISEQIAGEKTAAISASGAAMVLAGDLGCLLNIAGKLKRQGKPVQARHVAEILADMTDQPAIGEGSG